MPASADDLARLLRNYIEEVELAGRAAITARRYTDYVTTFLEWLAATSSRTAGTLRVRDISAERLRHYRLHLARKRDRRSGLVIGPATRNLYQTALRNFLRYCRRRGHDLPDPDEHLELAKTKDVEIRRLERDEALRIADAIRLDEPTGLRDRALIETLFGTAVRVSELVALTVRQINLESRETEVIGKGGRSRLVLITEEAAGWLGRYLSTRRDDSPYVFVSNRSDEKGLLRPLSVRQAQRIVDEAARRAGLPFRVSPHFFRHSRLSLLARFSGVQVAQRIAGHRSLQTTSRYLHVTDRTLRALFDQAEKAAGDEGRAHDG